MTKNTGTADRYIRFLIGVALLLNIIILEPGVFGSIVLLALGAGMLYSSFSGFCWVYGLLKIRTCGEDASCAPEKKA
jgi:hypothetical protein